MRLFTVVVSFYGVLSIVVFPFGASWLCAQLGGKKKETSRRVLFFPFPFVSPKPIILWVLELTSLKWPLKKPPK